MSDCPVCGAEVELSTDIIEGELIICVDCGTELEVTQVEPPVLAQAPQEEEDWGE